MVNLSSSLTGLSLLTGTDAFSALSASAVTVESRAVREAKALFTTPETTPPWQEEQTTLPISTQVSQILALRTLVDKAGTGTNTLPDDVQTAFTTYKALDRLRVLAEYASADSTSDAQRAKLSKTFTNGLADLQTFLADAPSDVLKLSYDKTARSVSSVGINAPSKYSTQGDCVVKGRDDPLPGLTGQEQISIRLQKYSFSDTVSVDLSAGPQPPTLDDIAAAFNAAITSIPARDTNGDIALDENGETQPRWTARFEVEKNDGKWGLVLTTPNGVEHVTLTQTNAEDALVVAAGQTPLDSPTATTVFRLNDPGGDTTRIALTDISALDRQETARNELLGETTTTTSIVYGADGQPELEANGKYKTTTTTTSDAAANTSASAVATDGDGNSYIVGTINGDLGAYRSEGEDNLYLTKVDGAGNIVWQRSLGGSGSVTGAAVTVGADGKVTVVGTVNGDYYGASTDGDTLVAQFDAIGTEQFETLIRKGGTDTARAVAVGDDGSVYVGGRVSSEGGDAYLVKLDSAGKIVDRRTIAEGGNETISALAVDKDGNVLALLNNSGEAQLRKIDGTTLSNDLATIDLGTADARAIAVADDGTIAVGGATRAALAGTQVNAPGEGRDGFVARIDADLTGSSVTYVATAADDQIDSVTFLNGDIYAGGRTKGDLAETRSGSTDGFVARIDSETGAISSTFQFGIPLTQVEPVQVTAAKHGANNLAALGFGSGTINTEATTKLVTETGLRAGDSFSLQVNDGTVRKITIGKDDTLDTLTNRIQAVLGTKGKVVTPLIDGKRQIRIDATVGNSIAVLSGPSSSDALEKLGIDPQTIYYPPLPSDDDPEVTPGGRYGLGLTEGYNLTTQDDAKATLAAIQSALSLTQTGYRSLYWDDSKAQRVDGVKSTSGGSTARIEAQLANYQAALTRLSSGNSNLLLGF